VSKPKHKQGSDPRCWWCHDPIPLDTPYRGEDFTLPPMVGVVVCTPACEQRPEGVKVYKHRDWRKR
jgi:hypothetical protein